MLDAQFIFRKFIKMKRELMEAGDTTTTDSSQSSMSYKRQRIQHSERMPIKAEQLGGMAATNAQPQNFAVRQQSAGKRRALNRDFATKLASITLTSGELCRLDALFGGAVGTDQLEQFNRAVSGCLCRLGRHAVDQRNDVIALIGAVVGPVDLHQMGFPRRRIFVFQLGYFEFEQIADQKPDLVDYGPWMADMDIQGLPLPSDEFIEQKAQMLQSFLADSAYQQQHFERVSVRQNVKMEHHHHSSTPTVSTTTTSQRTTVANDHGNNSVQQQHQDDVGDDDDDEDDDVQVLELATASSTKKTNMRHMEDDSDGDMDNGQQQQQAGCGGQQLEHDEEDDDDRESEQDSDDAETDEPPLDELVHSTELLKRVRVTLSSLRQLVSLDPFRQSLVGCLVACRVKKIPNNKNNNENFGVIVDEIVQADSDKLLFKHTSSAPLPLDKLADNEITDPIFRDWIDNLTKWGETLPLFSLYRQRRCALYDQLKKLKKSQKLSRAQRRKLRRAKKELGTNSQLLQQIKMTKKDVPKAVVTHQPQLQPNQQTKPFYGETFIREFGQIFVCPRELVQLHELGKSVFDRVAVGLYVKQHHGPWVEQITRVSLGAKPYTMYGQELTTVLHFEHAHRCTIKALHLFRAQNKMDFVKRHLLNNNDINEQQRQNNESNVPIQIKFDPPTVDYVRRKSQQLRDTLKKRRTQLANGPPKT